MKLFVFSALFSILFSLAARLQICINYFVNIDYYAQVLCENKDKEDSCCKGKCAMEKELSQLESEENNNPPLQESVVKFTKAEEALCTRLVLSLLPGIAAKIETPYRNGDTKFVVTPVFRPPIV